MNPDINASLVIMGVAGCGKSSLGAALAERLGFELIEGDDHHSPGNRDKMRQGRERPHASRVFANELLHGGTEIADLLATTLTREDLAEDRDPAVFQERLWGTAGAR